MEDSPKGMQAFSDHLVDMARDKRVSVAKMDRLKELGMALLEHDYELVQAIHAFELAQKPSSFGKVIALYAYDALAQLCARRVRKDRGGKEAAEAAEAGKGSAQGFLQFVDGVLDEVVGGVVDNGGVYWAEGLAKAKKILDIWLTSSICSRPTVERNLKRVEGAIAQAPLEERKSSSSSTSKAEGSSSKPKHRPSPSSSQAKARSSHAPRSSSKPQAASHQSTTPLNSPPADLRQKHLASTRSPSLPPLDGESEVPALGSSAVSVPTASAAAEPSDSEVVLNTLLASLAKGAPPPPVSGSPAIRDPSPVAPTPTPTSASVDQPSSNTDYAASLQSLLANYQGTGPSTSQAPLVPAPPPSSNSELAFLSQLQAQYASAPTPTPHMSASVPPPPPPPQQQQLPGTAFGGPYGYGQPSVPFAPPLPPPTLPGFGGAAPSMMSPHGPQSGFPGSQPLRGGPSTYSSGPIGPSVSHPGGAGPSQQGHLVPPPPVLGHLGGGGGRGGRGGFQSGRGSWTDGDRGGHASMAGGGAWNDGRSPVRPPDLRAGGPSSFGSGTQRGGYSGGTDGHRRGSSQVRQDSLAAPPPPRGREAAFQADVEQGRRRSRSPTRARLREPSATVESTAQMSSTASAEPVQQPRQPSAGSDLATAAAPSQPSPTPPAGASTQAVPPIAAAGQGQTWTLETFPWSNFSPADPACWDTLNQTFFASCGYWPSQAELSYLVMYGMASVGAPGAAGGGQQPQPQQGTGGRPEGGPAQQGWA